MDIFQTIITGGNIIYNFVDSYANASERSRSLATRLRWDLRVLSQFLEYYAAGEAKRQSQLSKDDEDLLEKSAEYLLELATKISATAERLQCKSRLRKELNKALWWYREEDIQLLEQELFEWTTRLDLRLVGLPRELKTVAELDQQQATTNSPNFAASISIQKLQSVTHRARNALDEALFRSTVDLPVESRGPRDHSRFRLMESNGATFLVESRFHHFPKDSKQWEDLKGGLLRLASALSCLDGTTVSLMRCEHLFHDDRDPLAPYFGFANQLPFPVVDGSCPTLKSLINAMQGSVRLPAAHPINDRFRLALSIATAVFFLHSVGFTHHSIASHNVVLFEREHLSVEQKFPHGLGKAFLVGFDAVKEDYSLTDGNGIPDADSLYQHPDRLFVVPRPKYGVVHDIHSLGMVFLEIALWKPLERYRPKLLSPDGEVREQILIELLRLAAISMGNRFKTMISWCLGRSSDETVDCLRFSKEVIEGLEDMVSVL
ncbi:hypothetical protein BU26DRAFT_526630 [Trematosphaeria pertusa]|uniref:Protein kinase domain-containing protein n=1 Tax=Trematosphaeria pertusa TaxID=390896 RepID=A0A6A6J050_9PLEO|nr:uncharacterized protein BU26DRAFT_526630 [Trematosphaeria pertusa]KAF2256094.1 hypothetical protein BU26DRAFT_526630 [Trematosphaeria pertusa]